MTEFLMSWFMQYDLDETRARYLVMGTLALLITLLSFLATIITQKVILRVLTHIINRNKFEWDNVMLERRVFHKLSYMVPGIIVYSFATVFPINAAMFIERFSSAYIILVGINVLDAILSSLDDIYRTYEVSKNKPIKGYLQVAKIFAYIIGGILVIATIIGQSPLLLLSGIGALTAVLLLVFKDSLLGLVAGIQLSSNDMVRLGDWIEMPKYGADGDVIEISLHTVKVENFDKTITMIPSYALVSDSFKNWRAMKQSGGRRIKRAINIDTTSVSFCTIEMLEDFGKIHLLSDYIKTKRQELEIFNQENNIDTTHLANGRRLTNLGTFRAYLVYYLKNHPYIHKDLIQMVRQLPPGEHGVPIEIYVFTNDTDWVNYESIQADIFDHILAVVPLFGLRVFQKPTGYDIRSRVPN